MLVCHQKFMCPSISLIKINPQCNSCTTLLLLRSYVYSTASTKIAIWEIVTPFYACHAYAPVSWGASEQKELKRAPVLSVRELEIEEKLWAN